MEDAKYGDDYYEGGEVDNGPDTPIPGYVEIPKDE